MLGMRAGRPTVAELAARIRALETAHHPVRTTPLPLRAAWLTELFSGEDLPSGSLLELLAAAEGQGGLTLALAMARQVCWDGRGLLIVDTRRTFYPPAAVAWGIDLERTLVVRPPTARAGLSVMVQALRCAAVGASVSWFDQMTSTDFRRLQLAAELGGGVGLLLRRDRVLGQPSFATVRLVVRPRPSNNGHRWLEVEVVRRRHGTAGRKVLVEVNDAAGSVRLSTPVGTATHLSRAAGMAP